MNDTRSDSALAAAALVGERDAFGVLVDRHASRVRAMARRMLASSEEAEDITQEALLNAYLGLARLRDPARFGSWLCGIAVNLAKMRLRQRRDQPVSDLRQFAVDGGTEAFETLQAVRDAIALLPLHERRAVLMHYLEGLSCEEIAVLIGQPAATVRVRLHRARHRLRERLAPMAPRVQQRRKEADVMVEVQVEDVVVRMLTGGQDEGRRLANERLRVVLLRERDGERVLPIWVGAPEGDALAYQLGGQATPRPLTVDLTIRLLEAAGARIDRVVISSLREKTFYATIVLSHSSERHELDGRPSDAINLALRCDAPIYVDEQVMEHAGKGELPELLDRDTDELGYAAETGPAEWRPLSLDVVRSLWEAPR